jgi:ornithine cyclodeaminase/alanine dehydrogenase-like protein (mu-crystallin family)
MAMKEVLPLETVRVYDVIKGASEKLAVEMEERLGLHVLAVDSSEKAVRGSDVVVTVTTSSERFLDADWLSEGSFVAAVGGQEIKLNVIRRSTKLVVEHLDTCKFDGNISEFFSTGQVTETDIYAELAEIVSGKKAGRQLDREINTFISAGLAMNDIVTANAVFQLAREKKIGLEVSF